MSSREEILGRVRAALHRNAGNAAAAREVMMAAFANRTPGPQPAVASASVHIAEVFTTGLSGLSHLKLKNICHKLFLRLLLPGITGALLGAYLAHIFHQPPSPPAQ